MDNLVENEDQASQREEAALLQVQFSVSQYIGKIVDHVVGEDKQQRGMRFAEVMERFRKYGAENTLITRGIYLGQTLNESDKRKTGEEYYRGNIDALVGTINNCDYMVNVRHGWTGSGESIVDGETRDKKTGQMTRFNTFGGIFKDCEKSVQWTQGPDEMKRLVGRMQGVSYDRLLSGSMVPTTDKDYLYGPQDDLAFCAVMDGLLGVYETNGEDKKTVINFGHSIGGNQVLLQAIEHGKNTRIPENIKLITFAANPASKTAESDPNDWNKVKKGLEALKLNKTISALLVSGGAKDLRKVMAAVKADLLYDRLQPIVVAAILRLQFLYGLSEERPDLVNTHQKQYEGAMNEATTTAQGMLEDKGISHEHLVDCTGKVGPIIVYSAKDDALVNFERLIPVLPSPKESLKAKKAPIGLNSSETGGHYALWRGSEANRRAMILYPALTLSRENYDFFERKKYEACSNEGSVYEIVNKDIDDFSKALNLPEDEIDKYIKFRIEAVQLKYKPDSMVMMYENRNKNPHETTRVSGQSPYRQKLMALEIIIRGILDQAPKTYYNTDLQSQREAA